MNFNKIREGTKLYNPLLQMNNIAATLFDSISSLDRGFHQTCISAINPREDLGRFKNDHRDRVSQPATHVMSHFVSQRPPTLRVRVFRTDSPQALGRNRLFDPCVSSTQHVRTQVPTKLNSYNRAIDAQISRVNTGFTTLCSLP